jgi:hypothetical protein
LQHQQLHPFSCPSQGPRSTAILCFTAPVTGRCDLPGAFPPTQPLTMLYILLSSLRLSYEQRACVCDMGGPGGGGGADVVSMLTNIDSRLSEMVCPANSSFPCVTGAQRLLLHLTHSKQQPKKKSAVTIVKQGQIHQITVRASTSQPIHSSTRHIFTHQLRTSTFSALTV